MALVEITTELSLGLPGGYRPSAAAAKNEKKRMFSEFAVDNSQVVGWPPVCSYRIKNLALKESKPYVKVSMDGTPFMRKIDLANHKGYSDLVAALEKLFNCFCSGGVLKDSESSEYTPIYEDKDGDWMLVGDVPWKMFIDSCKRLRIMKHSDSNELQLQARISKKDYHGQGAKATAVEWSKTTNLFESSVGC